MPPDPLEMTMIIMMTVTTKIAMPMTTALLLVLEAGCWRRGSSIVEPGREASSVRMVSLFD